MEVWRNGSQILASEWKRKQVKWLLALLLARPGAVLSYDILIDALLGAGDPLRGRRNLYALVSKLRRTLEPDLDRPAQSAFIVRRGEGYAFNTEAPYSLDTQTFAVLVEEGASLEGDGRWAEAKDRYRAAIDLYTDDYLSENRYEEWTLEFRDDLRDRYLRALEGLAACHATMGDIGAAITCCRRLIRAAPHDERGYRQVMQYHYHAGEIDQAEGIFREYAHALRESLDVDPSPGLVELREQILAGTAPRLESWIPHNLPSPITSFVGRNVEIAELRDAIGTSRLVTLLGPGGIGKTRLAIETGFRLREMFRDGVWLVDFGRVSEGENVPKLVATALGITVSADQSSTDAIAHKLRPKSCLLILDTCEMVIGEVAPFVEALLEICPELRVLATSRECFDVSFGHM